MITDARASSDNSLLSHSLDMSGRCRSHSDRYRARTHSHNRTSSCRRAASTKTSTSTTRHTTRPILIQRRRIQHTVIRTNHKLMRQMRAIMERQPAPSIRLILRIRSIAVKRPCQDSIQELSMLEISSWQSEMLFLTTCRSGRTAEEGGRREIDPQDFALSAWGIKRRRDRQSMSQTSLHWLSQTLRLTSQDMR